MGRLLRFEDYKVDEDFDSDVRALSPAMIKYLKKADSKTGLLPEKDLEGRTIMIRTVRALEWREFVRSSLVDVERGEVQGINYGNEIHRYYITQRGRRALEKYSEIHS